MDIKSIKQESIDFLKKKRITNKKTVYHNPIGKPDFSLDKTFIKKDDILKLLPGESIYKVYKNYEDNKITFIEKNPNELDKKLMNLIFPEGIYPITFKNKSSKTVQFIDIDSFYKKHQYSDNYLMPVTVKSVETRKVTSSANRETKKVTTTSYVSTARNNINSVRSVAFDVDIHNDEFQPEKEELIHIARAVDFFATENCIPPTAIVVTGRGVQIHYVLEEPVYRNSERIDSLLHTFYKTIKERLNNTVLNQIQVQYESRGRTKEVLLKCDEAINPINQKLRAPGTYNYAAGMYANTVVLHGDNKYNLSQTLTELNGEYINFKEINKETKVKKKSSGKRTNNGNGKSNLRIALRKRVDDIKDAMALTSSKIRTGFRNNSYLTLVWQMLELEKVDKEFSRRKMIKELEDLDKSLEIPYFRNSSGIESFVSAVEDTRSRAKNTSLTNKTVEGYCIALQIAKEEDMDFRTFFRKTVEEKRLLRKTGNKSKKALVISRIKQMAMNHLSVSDMAKELGISRSSVYNYISQLLSSLKVRVKQGLSIVGNLRRGLIKELLERKQKNSEDKQMSSTYILFNTESLYTPEQIEPLNFKNTILQEIKT